MKNSFEKIKVELSLNLREMHVLQHIVGNVVPDGKEKEILVIYVYNKLTEEINNFDK